MIKDKGMEARRADLREVRPVFCTSLPARWWFSTVLKHVQLFLHQPNFMRVRMVEMTCNALSVPGAASSVDAVQK